VFHAATVERGNYFWTEGQRELDHSVLKYKFNVNLFLLEEQFQDCLPGFSSRVIRMLKAMYLKIINNFSMLPVYQNDTAGILICLIYRR
jgi:hypothetical protein